MPINDNRMVYDENLHMYVLSEECIQQELGEDLKMLLNASDDFNPATIIERFLQKISLTVYRYIYSESLGVEYLEYLLAKYKPLRERIKEMLKSQVEYVLLNGFLNDYCGINIAKGVLVDIEKLRGRAKISDDVEMLANMEIPGLGYSLKYIGRLPILPKEDYRNGY